MVAARACEATLKVLLGSLAGCFARIEPRRKAGQYVRALMSDLVKRNGLDAAAAPGRLRIGALDETGQVKKGASTAGVQRQHMGCADGIANGINTVHLAYVVERCGHALIAHRLWVPAFQLADACLRKAMGLSISMRRARAKGRIAIDLLAQALREGVGFDFICGDEVYGSCPILRAWCERVGQAYVLRVAKNFRLDFGPRGTFTCERAVTLFASARSQWRAYPAGTGAKGARAYAWTWFDLPGSPGHTLLVRRHRSSGKLAFHYCWTPPGRQVTLRDLIRAAGLRWPVKECFAIAKDDFGLDQSQVRTYTAIRRHTTLVCAALAVCAVAAAALRSRTDRRAKPARTADQARPERFGQIPISVPEIRHLWPGEHQGVHTRAHRVHWSAWRRTHQTKAQWYHQRRNLHTWDELHQLTT